MGLEKIKLSFSNCLRDETEFYNLAQFYSLDFNILLCKQHADAMAIKNEALIELTAINVNEHIEEIKSEIKSFNFEMNEFSFLKEMILFNERSKAFKNQFEKTLKQFESVINFKGDEKDFESKTYCFGKM